MKKRKKELSCKICFLITYVYYLQVRRVQGLTDKVDSLKVQNSIPHSNNAVVVTTKWESFDSGFGSLSAPPPSASSNVTMNWEVLD